MFMGSQAMLSAPPTNWTSCAIFYEMFDSSNFNGSVAGWTFKSSGSISMQYMFQANTSFNQDVSSWDVSTITSMAYMFDGASSFNQDISGWDISNVTSFTLFMRNASAFSTANYDLLLNAWSLLTVSAGESLTVVPAYTITTSQAARDILTGSPNNWTISDGGGV